MAVSSPDGVSFLLVTEPGGFEAFMRTRAEPAQSLTLPPAPSSPPTPHSSPPTPPNTAST